jgi:hypothetical protein
MSAFDDTGDFHDDAYFDAIEHQIANLPPAQRYPLEFPGTWEMMLIKRRLLKERKQAAKQGTVFASEFFISIGCKLASSRGWITNIQLTQDDIAGIQAALQQHFTTTNITLKTLSFGGGTVGQGPRGGYQTWRMTVTVS